MKKKARQRGSVILIALFAGILAGAAICAATPTIQTYGVFDITFYNSGDSDGYATGEQDWTVQQMSDVQTSISAWQSSIGNTPGRQVQMHLFWKEMGDNSILGSSSSVKVGNGTTIWNLGEYVWKKGINTSTSTYGFDTVIQYDITAGGISWNFGLENPGGSEVDFRSVITHEIGHSLGWSSTYDYIYDDWGWLATGEEPYGGDYYGLSAWDKNLVDSAGNHPLSGGTGTPGNFNEIDAPVYFDGVYATSLFGELVPIYAPNPYRKGSSLSHLDEAVLGSLLMSPAIAPGQLVRTVSELEWAMMKDMGWTIVPEPATIFLFAIAGLYLKRKSS